MHPIRVGAPRHERRADGTHTEIEHVFQLAGRIKIQNIDSFTDNRNSSTLANRFDVLAGQESSHGADGDSLILRLDLS
jgi:hypothetical protein